MAAIIIYIRWIDKVKRLRAIVPRNDFQGIVVLDRHVLQSFTDRLRELIPCVADLERCGSAPVIPECAVLLGREREFRERPHRPCPLRGTEEFRIPVDVQGVGVLIPAVQRAVDLLSE